MGSTAAGLTATAAGTAARVRRPGVAVWGVVAALVAVGAYMRLANLDELGFRWDEKYSSLAVKAILEHGVPELPSGMIYLRGTWFSYLMAASSHYLGHGELALRLPAALFGVALIPVAFLFGRALLGVRAGLLVAALVTVSPWDIELARYARMYAPFAVFYLLTMLCIWRYRVQRESTVGGWLCIALAAVTLSLHQLGYTLALAFLFPVLMRGRPLAQPARLVFPLAACALVGSLAVLANVVLDYYRQVPLREAADASAAGATPNAATGAIQTLASALPDTPLLAALWQRAPAFAVALGVAAVVVLAAYLESRRWRGGQADDAARDAADVALLVGIAAAAVLQLFNVALLAAALLAFRRRAGLAALGAPDVRFALGFIGAAFAVWLAGGVAFGLAGTVQDGLAQAARGTIRALLDFPRFAVFWGYANEWPLASLAAAIGALWAFDRAARRPPDRAALFALLAFATPLVMNGLFETEFEIFRYNVPFDTFFFVLVALGILRWHELVPALRAAAGRRPRPALAAGTALVALLAFGLDLSPAKGLLIPQRDYRTDSAIYRWLGLAAYPDYKTPAAFVAAAADEDDKILALDSREYYDYIGRLDYWVRSRRYESQAYEEDGRWKDLYLDTPLIMSVTELESVLRSPGTTWLIASDAMLTRSGAIDAEIKQFLDARREHVVYVSRDGITKVYRFDPPQAQPARGAAATERAGA